MPEAWQGSGPAVTLPAAPAPPGSMNTRFFLVNYLTTYVALLYLLVLVWAGRGRGTSFERAWQTASRLTATQIVLIALLVLVIAVLVTPFQLGLVRVLEGAWPRRLGGDRGTRRERERKDDLRSKAVPKSTEAEALWSAGTAGLRLRMRYPLPDHLIRSTRLGNVIAAMGDRSGRDYGLDAVVAWPRLYPLLDSTTKAVVDDRRTTLDTMARMAVTMAVTAVASAGVLLDAGWWSLLAFAPAVISVIAYHGTVLAALAYSESVQAAFDLHHLALGAAFGLPRPDSSAAERIANRNLCDLWRQSIPHPFKYVTEEPATTPSTGAAP